GILMPYLAFAFFVVTTGAPNRAALFVRALAIAVTLLVVGSITNFAGLINSGWIQDRLHNVSSIYARVATYLAALRITLSHPLLGVGYGRYTEVAANYMVNVKGYASLSVPHDTFLAFSAEGGLVGFGLFVAW